MTQQQQSIIEQRLSVIDDKLTVINSKIEVMLGIVIELNNKAVLTGDAAEEVNNLKKIIKSIEDEVRA